MRQTNEYRRGWNKRNPEKVKGYCSNWQEKNPGVSNELVRRYRKRIRFDVLSHYSGGSPRCACCGEETLEFLCIDHINGGGDRERKKTGGNVYAWLKKNEYPLGYRVLCHNCNSALGFYGYCPHSEVKCELTT